MRLLLAIGLGTALAGPLWADTDMPHAVTATYAGPATSAALLATASPTATSQPEATAPAPVLAPASAEALPIQLPAPTPKADTARNGNEERHLVLAMDRILPGATEDKLKALLGDETRAVLNLYLAGQLRQWFFRQDRPGVVFVLEASDLDAARATLRQLPLAKAGLVDYDIVPIGPYIPLATLLQSETGKKARKR